MNALRNMKIKHKSIALSVFLLVNFAIIGLSFKVAHDDEQKALQIEKEEKKYSHLVDSIEIRILQARRREKDFIIRKDPNYMEKYEAEMGTIYKHLEELRALNSDAEEARMIAEVERLLSTYQAEFKKMAQLQIEIGLNEKSGLLGTLRKYVHGVEEDLKQHDNLELTNSMLMMRRHEKDYMARKSDKYIKRMASEQQKFNSRLAATDFDAQTKSKISASMADYHKVFNAIVSTEKKIVAQIAHFRESVHAVEPALNALIEHAEKRMNATIAQLVEEAGRMSMIFVIVLVGVAVIGSGTVFTMFRMITRSLTVSVSVAERIAAGDLSKEIEVKSKNETGQLLQAMKTMQANLKESIEADRRNAAEMGRIKTALDNVSGNVMVADSEGKIIYLNRAVEKMFRDAERQLRGAVAEFSADALQGGDLDRLYESLSGQNARLSQIGSRHGEEFEVGGRTYRTVANPVFDETRERLGTAVEWTDRTAEVAVEHEVQGIVEAAQAGDLSQRIDPQGKDGFFLKLSEGLNALIEVSERVINDTVRVLSSMAGGNLTQTIEADYHGTFGQLKRDANATVAKLTEVIGRIKAGTESVSSGAGEISQGNTNLSQRTEEQAANLEETASSMEQMTATVKQNADNARQANQLASGARERAEKGGQVVGDAVSAMTEISAASKKIADIIGVIDEIAFQTNLLALNAAVEAARAGEQGRGFAVVASEVRNLAQRSATAAKEIKGLIQDSVGKVEQGSALVDQSGQTLGEIVTAVKRVSDIVAEIAAASTEQSSGIEEVNKAIMQMDDMTQQNAALVEQAAAAAESMDEQARSMKQQMDFFTVAERAIANVAREARSGAGGSANFDFSDACSKHLLWKSRLRRFLDGKESMSTDQAVSHKYCDLGKWIYSSGIKQYGYMEEMQELKKVHKHLHEIIHRIVDFKRAGKADQAEQEFKQVEPISNQVVSLLNGVERHAKQDAGKGASQAPAAKQAPESPRVERRSATRPWSNAQSKAKATPKPVPRRAASGGDDGDWEEF